MARYEPDRSPRTADFGDDDTAWSAETTSVRGPVWERHDRTHLEVSLR